MEVEQTEVGRRLRPLRKSAQTKKSAGRGWCLQAAPIGVFSRSEGRSCGGRGQAGGVAMVNGLPILQSSLVRGRGVARGVAAGEGVASRGAWLGEGAWLW